MHPRLRRVARFAGVEVQEVPPHELAHTHAGTIEAVTRGNQLLARQADDTVEALGGLGEQAGDVLAVQVDQR